MQKELNKHNKDMKIKRKHSKEKYD